MTSDRDIHGVSVSDTDADDANDPVSISDAETDDTDVSQSSSL